MERLLWITLLYVDDHTINLFPNHLIQQAIFFLGIEVLRRCRQSEDERLVKNVYITVRSNNIS